MPVSCVFVLTLLTVLRLALGAGRGGSLPAWPQPSSWAWAWLLGGGLGVNLFPLVSRVVLLKRRDLYASSSSALSTAPTLSTPASAACSCACGAELLEVLNLHLLQRREIAEDGLVNRAPMESVDAGYFWGFG